MTLAADLLADLPEADVRSILVLFCTDLDRLLPDVARAADLADVESFRRACHAIAGAAGAVGAAALETAPQHGMTIAKGEATRAGLATAALAVAEAAAALRGDLAALVARLPEA
jgi:HPt (histidine-containing phosphotransfer) domain-containing protein